MYTRRITVTAAAAAFLVLTALPAAAQQGGHGHGGEMMHGQGMMAGGHGGAMHAAMAFGPGPAMLLHQKEALGLSQEQAGRLDSLQAAMHARMEEHRAAMKEIHGSMQELTSSGAPDMTRYRELLQRMADARVALAVEAARTHRRAMSVLTEEQRSNARYGMELMHRMMGPGHGQHGQGGMMGGHRGMGMDHHMMQEHRGQMQRDSEVRIRKRIHRDTAGTDGNGNGGDGGDGGR